MKNLPKYIDEDRLRNLFSEKGEITDVKLMRTKYFSYPTLDLFLPFVELFWLLQDIILTLLHRFW